MADKLKKYRVYEGRNRIKLVEDIPKRVCLANNRYGDQCDRVFKPKNRFNFICQECQKHIRNRNEE